MRDAQKSNYTLNLGSIKVIPILFSYLTRPALDPSTHGPVTHLVDNT